MQGAYIRVYTKRGQNNARNHAGVGYIGSIGKISAPGEVCNKALLCAHCNLITDIADDLKHHIFGWTARTPTLQTTIMVEQQQQGRAQGQKAEGGGSGSSSQ
ncbi:MAG: hypothetical protein ACJ70X_09565 [Nitrososphaera sp.]